MRRVSLALVTGGAMVIAAAHLAAAETKVSGTVVDVRDDGRTFTLEEIGVAGIVVRRAVTLGPAARIVVVERRPAGADDTGPGAWPGGFTERPALVRDVRLGEFVTVTLGEAEAPSVKRSVEVARSVEIVQPEDGGGAAASPAAGVELPPRR